MPVSTSLALHSGRTEIVTATQTTSVVYSIAHALPGRVGFCVPRITFDSEYEQRLLELLASENWIKSQFVNKIAGSIVVNYKMEVMSDADMRSQLVNLIQRAGEVEVVTQQVSEILENSLTEINLQSATNEEVCTHNAIEILEVKNAPVSSSVSEPAIDNLQSVTNEEVCTHNATEIVEVKNTPVSSSVSEPAIERQQPPPKVAYSIAHAIPGRVRFRIPRIASDPKYVQSLEALLKADLAVTSERVNSAAASIVITYKTGLMLDAQKQCKNAFNIPMSYLDSLIQSASCLTGSLT
ncbi:MAG: hypothetical protein PUP91_29665 [Rhizonema sp. PD37]|nr:hypothetical protein [Rhizonema sp. PD37]